MSDAPGRPVASALYFEDIARGLSIETPARTITEHDVVTFAGLSGDYNPLHTDAEFARGTPYGQRIAHGVLGLAVATGLAARLGIMEGTALAFLGLEWKFRKPVLFGDTIRVVIEVAGVKAMPSMGGGVVTFNVRLLNQRDEVVQRGTWNILMRSRGDNGAGAGARV
jgi:3-hydroxybutyryl-CoA dehydratase